MAKKHFFTLIFLVLILWALAGCGIGDSSVVDSPPEALQTFGVQVNPSAQPSMGQVMPGTPTADAEAPITGENSIDGNDVEHIDPYVSTAPEAELSPPSGNGSGSGSYNPGSPTIEPSPSNSPTIAPPAPMSSATVDDVMDYVGEPLSKLIEDLGYPSSSDYELVDDTAPSKGEIGTLYFKDFIVKTRREGGNEIITAVTPKESPSPETSSEPVPETSPEA